MVKIKYYFIIFFSLIFSSLFSQTVEIEGVVTGNTDVENIHVINRTSNKFTTTNKFGAFSIEAKILDTLVISSVQYKLKAILITPKIISEKK